MEQKKQILDIHDLYYKMNHENRGPVYVINDYFENRCFNEKTKDFQKSLKHLGFWPFKISRRNGQHLKYIENDVKNAVYKKDDCVVIVVLSTMETGKKALSKLQDLDVMDHFYSDKNEGLECKPRLYFFLYEMAPKTNNNTTTDSLIAYALPIMADQLVIHMMVDKLPKALKEISKVMMKIDATKYYMNDLPELVQQVHHISMTVTSTLTRRFLLSEKKINYDDELTSILKYKNRLLLFLIRNISEMIFLDDVKYVTYYEENKLDDIERKIVESDIAEIPDRDKLIEELNALKGGKTS